MDWLRRRKGVLGSRGKPLLKRDIELAQSKTKSAAGAARYLGVSYNTYKKYAKMYGIHERHLNPGGKGIPKNADAGTRIPLSDILDGKHPSYNIKMLKNRLIKSGLFDEECAMCGFNERRVTDYKMPLILVFKDGDRSNHALENMDLLCFNCAFLTVGEINNINVIKVKNLSEIGYDDGGAYSERDDIDLEDDEISQVIAEAKQELENEQI